MGYKPRDESPGVHHVTCRGNNKRIIFVDDRDRRVFLKRLKRVARLFGWKILTYCLMDNHYHLVIEVDERGMSRGFCQLHTGYAVEFNRRHGRVNHLFGKRYWNTRLKSDRAVLSASRYVLLNPVRAGLAEHPDRWRWSSYQATIGAALADVPLAGDDLLVQVSNDRGRAIEAFRMFVAAEPPSRARGQPP